MWIKTEQLENVLFLFNGRGDWTQGLQTESLACSYFSFLRYALAKWLSCTGWAWAWDPPSLASQSTRLTRVDHCPWLMGFLRREFCDAILRESGMGWRVAGMKKKAWLGNRRAHPWGRWQWPVVPWRMIIWEGDGEWAVRGMSWMLAWTMTKEDAIHWGG